MTDSTHNQEPKEVCIGQFQVSKSAVENSRIGGPEDVYGLIVSHWKSVATVVVLFFIITTYQGRIAVLEEQVGSLNSIYENLPEEKALAVGALRSVKDMREALTVVVEGQAIDLFGQPGFVRGGEQALWRLRDLSEVAAGFGKLWEGRESEMPAIYSIVDAVEGSLSDGEGLGSLKRIQPASSRVAYGIAQFVLGNRAAQNGPVGAAEALSYLRAANKNLPSLSVVRGQRIALELSAGDVSWLGGNQEAFLAAYQSWWPKWQELAAFDDSLVTEFVVAHGMAEALAFPIFALSTVSRDEGDPKALSLTAFEEALGQSFESALRTSVQMASKARDLNVDRLPGLIATAELDLALGAFFASEQQPAQRRRDAWEVYQDAAQQFQGVALDLAKSTLANHAYEALQAAQQLARAHGEHLDLAHRLIGNGLLQGLKQEHQIALGMTSAPSDEAQH